MAAWLAIEGRQITAPKDLLDRLAARLDAAGAHIDRMGISTATLHPQLVAWGCFWRSGLSTGMFEGQHDAQNSDAYVGSPLQFVREQHQSFRRRIENLDAERDHTFLFEMQAAGMTDYAAYPMVFASGTVNVFTAATRTPGGFSDADLERIEALANLLAFNVVGPAVNKTARLQSMTKEAGEPMLLSKEFAARIARPLRSIGHFDLRGVSGPQEMFTLANES